MLDGIAIAGPAAEVAERCEARHPRGIARNQHRKTGPDTRSPPGHAILECDRIVGENGGGGSNDLVVDLEKAGEVGFGRVADVHTATYSDFPAVRKPNGPVYAQACGKTGHRSSFGI